MSLTDPTPEQLLFLSVSSGTFYSKKMKAKLKPSKTHHGPQTWKRISSPPMFRRARILIYSRHKKGGRLKEKELKQSILEPPVCSSICICKMLQCMREARKLWYDAVNTDRRLLRF
ncbi:hypothetical protein PRUPE_1G053700 [Prunus persica]|uniref:Uncharacterized protein n=1 Tax=Prunus persica TaxID=3760 RepID=A0A251QSZ1_PRUPE|nr:hypothetical protein PRUPE_1G053700 [Prunus persica]